jgi:hypothetical protein
VTTKEFSAILLGATRSVMAEPKKETVRNALPHMPEATPGLRNDGAKRDMARIPLPARTPAILPRRSPPTIAVLANVAASPIPHPLPKPASVSIQSGPTTRPAATILQPAQVIAATARAINAFDSIPRRSCWVLLAISAIIFLIEIWNYALS